VLAQNPSFKRRFNLGLRSWETPKHKKEGEHGGGVLLGCSWSGIFFKHNFD
jgi:hypothetical protein